jgi:hypothetical protein
MTPEEKKFEIQRIKDDDFLSAAEKKQRIAELDKGGGAQEYDRLSLLRSTERGLGFR